MESGKPKVTWGSLTNVQTDAQVVANKLSVKECNIAMDNIISINNNIHIKSRI